MNRPRLMLAAALFASAVASQALAADVKIGVIYPLTGNAASAGSSAKDAVTLGVAPGKAHLFEATEDGAALRDERT